MNINQEFHLKQTHHEINFFAYDIEKVEKITPYNLSRIFIPECSDRDTLKGCNQRNIKELCCKCHCPHLQELLLDGWYVGDKNGFLNDDSYYAELQTGIRVPVNKEIYDAWKQGWDSDEPHSSGSKVYEL
ncbi:MAG: hypothetical protein IJA10_10990 [Lachnospiraceae bacterium]|nr:hypothetical protein [Lachnospiraceae bacterium]